jgi:hypothetical protein
VPNHPYTLNPTNLYFGPGDYAAFLEVGETNYSAVTNTTAENQFTLGGAWFGQNTTAGGANFASIDFSLSGQYKFGLNF